MKELESPMIALDEESCRIRAIPVAEEDASAEDAATAYISIITI
jgi:hypothetical protein